MKGRSFLDPARDLLAGPTEAHSRTAAGRAYYAAFQEAHAALKRWGAAIPTRENIHSAVRLRFLYAADPDAKQMASYSTIWSSCATRRTTNSRPPDAFAT